jgi:hypothetical protein
MSPDGEFPQEYRDQVKSEIEIAGDLRRGGEGVGGRDGVGAGDEIRPTHRDGVRVFVSILSI